MSSIDETIRTIEFIALSAESREEKWARAREVAADLGAMFILAHHDQPGGDEAVKSLFVSFRDALETAALRSDGSEAGELFKTLSQEV